MHTLFQPFPVNIVPLIVIGYLLIITVNRVTFSNNCTIRSSSLQKVLTSSCNVNDRWLTMRIYKEFLMRILKGWCVTFWRRRFGATGLAPAPTRRPLAQRLFLALQNIYCISLRLLLSEIPRNPLHKIYSSEM